MMNLKGKVGIVTGGARGIGAAASHALCEAGARVVLADILADQGEATASALREQGHDAAFAQLDIRDESNWAKIVSDLMGRGGRLDFLVNNAGRVIPLNIEQATADDFRTMFEINVLGAFNGMRACLPAMKANGGGSVVNIASTASRKVSAVTTIYGASKAALANLTKAAAVHFAESGTGIRVNSIHPGPVDTEFIPGGLQSMPPSAIDAIKQSIPIKRLAEAEDVSGAIVFLVSDASAYITGVELYVDGGLSAV